MKEEEFRKCECCGEVKPIEKFSFHILKDGTKSFANVCRKCYYDNWKKGTKHDYTIPKMIRKLEENGFVVLTQETFNKLVNRE